MNRDTAYCSHLIHQKMHRKDRRRHLQRLQQIRLRPSEHLSEAIPPKPSSLHNSERHLEIEKNNITLFNKIAHILKETPRPEEPRSRLHVQSLDQAVWRQERRMEELKARNGDLVRRLQKQQPTIKNDLILRDRLRNERYLGFIGKYPFPHSRPRRSHSDFQLAHNQSLLPALPVPLPVESRNSTQEPVFQQTTLDFEVSIVRQPKTDQYLFGVRERREGAEYRVRVEGEQFREGLESCGGSYQKLVGKLRLQRNGEMSLSVGGAGSSGKDRVS